MAETFIPELCERIRDAGARKAPLRVRAGGSKDFYGGTPAGELLDVSAYSGIVAYEPKELVLTVKAGHLAREVERVPRRRAPDARLRTAALRQRTPRSAGPVAAGLSGPRRPFAGAARDFVLGARIVNGKGEDLSFGGRVIKNVAGYDVRGS
jgi:glycolate oxidase FAD binding subunit